MNPERWAILGGVFDPVHYGHLTIADQVCEALDLDRVLLVPAGKPVHRDPARASADDRVRMLELAIEGNPKLTVSRIEIDSDLSGYSADTVQRLADERPWHNYYFIVSAEAAALLPTWHEPARLIDLAEIAIVPRFGYPDIDRVWLDEHFRGRADRFSFVETSRLGHSSSDIRARASAGKSIRYLVPPAVERYIGEHQLYGAHDRPTA